MSSNRYLRQIEIVGEKGQKQLTNAIVGIVGLGGLGSNCSTHLASAGIGHFILVDYQYPEPSNLNRQFIHAATPSNISKVQSTSNWIRTINPDAEVTALNTKIENTDAKNALDECDIILDCLDSYDSRMALNNLSLAKNKILIHAAVQDAHGQVTVIVPGRTPCLRCIMPTSRSGSNNIIGAAAGVLGAIQSMEALKVITGLGSVLQNKLLSLDLLTNIYQTHVIQRNEFCDSCKD